MGYVNYNTNPINKLVGDCVIRAISVLTDTTWDETFLDLMQTAYEMKDMPSSNHVWGEHLKRKGFRRTVIPDTCPACYTVKDFCLDNKVGRFLLATGSHVIAVVDGDYYDTWDSGNEIPIYYWRKGD